MPGKLTAEEFLLKAGYSSPSIKLYLEKVNVGAMENPSVTSTYVGLPCGDRITIYLKLGENETIQEAKFEYDGCVGTACSGSALTLLITHKTIEEAWRITKEDVLDKLGGLPESHCAEIAVNALRKALENLESRKTNCKTWGLQ